MRPSCLPFLALLHAIATFFGYQYQSQHYHQGRTFVQRSLLKSACAVASQFDSRKTILKLSRILSFNFIRSALGQDHHSSGISPPISIRDSLGEWAPQRSQLPNHRQSPNFAPCFNWNSTANCRTRAFQVPRFLYLRLLLTFQLWSSTAPG